MRRFWHHSLLASTITALGISAIGNCAERIEFTSKSPYEFSEVINDLDDAVKVKAYGDLEFPSNKDKSKRYPTVVALAGPYGFRAHHDLYLKKLRDAGFATFKVYSFQSRGIKPKEGKVETRVSPEMMATDAYFALQRLQKHPNIIPDKIGLIGWASSGGAVLYSTWGPAKKAYLKRGQKGFAAHVSIYPPCMMYPQKADWQNIPTKIIIGEKDQSTPVKACKKLVKQMRSSKMPVEIDVLKNAYHGFDRIDPLKKQKDSYTFAKCQFELEPDGVSVHPKTGIRMVTPFFRLAAIYACVEKKDLRSGHNKQAQAKSIASTVKFFQQHLRN